MTSHKEAYTEWENVKANQFYHDVRGHQWETVADARDGFWECSETGETLSPEKMRMRVWEETCGVPAGATSRRPKYYVEWDDSEPRIVRWYEDSDEEPLTFAEAKKEVLDHFNYQIDWYRAQAQNIRNLRTKDIEE